MTFSIRTVSVLAIGLAVATTLPASDAHASRIMEICDIEGVRPNQLIGYGIVVGLANTGDTGSARFTQQSVAAMLRRLGATIDPAMVGTRNAAAVMVTATIPASSRPGTRIDVTVSSLGNARSLVGGTLLQTPLLGADGTVYAAAQGSLVIGGFGASGASGSSATLNHLTAGSVPDGAIVERAAPGAELPLEGPVVLTLRDPSFVTSRRIADAIDALLGAGVAHPVDGGSVEVYVPVAYDADRVGLIAQLVELEVDPELPARVVIDERTGTVVVGEGVRLHTAAVAHGGLMVAISESTAVTPAMPFTTSDAVAAPSTEIVVADVPGTLHYLPAATALHDVVNALNALGASPRDLVSILEALHSAGALEAEIVVE